MINRVSNIPRRHFFVGTAAAWLLCGVQRGVAAIPQYPALTTPAIPVKNPAQVLLVAITRTPANRLVAAGEHGVVIYSDDDGLNWKQARVPVNLTLTCIRFATDKIGWAVGHAGVILKTEDAGESWVMQLNGNQVNKMMMGAAQAPNVQNSPSPAAPLALVRAQHFADGGPDIPFLTMIVFSPQKMLALGAYRIAAMTNDGGKTWQDWSLNIYYRLSRNIYDATEIDGDYYLAAEMGLVFCSTDGGNSFLQLSSPSGTSLFGILGAKDGTLIVFGVAGSAYSSKDQGKTWTPINISTQDDLTGGRVLSSGSIVVTSESGQIFESKDNGASFTALPNIQSQPFFDVQEASNGALIAVGAAGITDISKLKWA